jgi:tetratricopeptide (TPR) repeat protein
VLFRSDGARAFRAALCLSPALGQTLVGLSDGLRALGQHEAAAVASLRALRLDPTEKTAHVNLAVALGDSGRSSEAIAPARRALVLDPGYGFGWLTLGRLSAFGGDRISAGRPLRRGVLLTRGGPRPDDGAGLQLIVAHKLRHDAEQIEHLLADGLLAPSYADIARGFRRTLAELDAAGIAEAPPSATQRRRIGRWYNRLLHLAPCAALPDGALSPALDGERLDAEYRSRPPGLTWIDGLLRPEALDRLRRFCLESTIWFDDQKKRGYVGAYWYEGFYNDLLIQIADELRQLVPNILGRHQLRKIWAYKYDQARDGIHLHADFAAVNVNFWLTPDEANLDPESGGLVVNDAQAPLDWSFDDYNADPRKGEAFIAENNGKWYRVPHRQNRALMFHSNLFHATDAFRFRPGYENRRINVTMLFGDRADAD